MLNLTSLQRTFNPKFISYQSDGMGRDKYILQHNGGLSKQKESNPYSSTRFPSPPRRSISPMQIYQYRKETTAFKYISDGKGRDTYILQSSGGLHSPYIPGAKSKEQLFISSLRSASKIERNFSTKADYLSNQYGYKTKNQRITLRDNYKKQFEMSKRLSCPRIAIEEQKNQSTLIDNYSDQLAKKTGNQTISYPDLEVSNLKSNHFASKRDKQRPSQLSFYGTMTNPLKVKKTLDNY